MYTERLLARIRKAVADMDGTEAERVRCSGPLTQMLFEHARLGRERPAPLSRADVERCGVQLRRGRARRPAPPKNGFCYWLAWHWLLVACYS